jgi:SAM-dependent methyltransferase
MEYSSFLAARALTICDNWMWELSLRRNVERLSRSLAEAEILDIGCGQGLIAEFFTSLGGHVTGIDIVLSAQWRGSLLGGPKYVCGNSEKLPFHDDAFDIVVSCSTLQYMDHSSVFAEIIRVTKDGGIVLLHENMPYNPVILLYRLVRRVRALFSASLKSYSSTITKYLGPEYSFPAAMRLENYKCYYFLSSVCFLLRLRKNIVCKFNLAHVLFRLDCCLLNQISFLHKFCWFCSYILSIRKQEAKHGADSN